MEKYKYLPHTADIKFQAFGGSLEEAFSNAALAMTRIIVDHSKVEVRIRKEIDVESEDKQALLYDFLEQFLILLDTENFLLHEVKSLKITEGKKLKLNAVVVGDDDISKYKIEGSIKAVTYQQMMIKKEKDKFMVQVVVDI
jgi:SHS2 domain-containing protein